MTPLQFKLTPVKKSFRISSLVLLLMLCCFKNTDAQKLSIEKTQFGYSVSCKVNDIELLQAPSEGLWVMKILTPSEFPKTVLMMVVNSDGVNQEIHSLTPSETGGCENGKLNPIGVSHNDVGNSYGVKDETHS